MILTDYVIYAMFVTTCILREKLSQVTIRFLIMNWAWKTAWFILAWLLAMQLEHYFVNKSFYSLSLSILLSFSFSSFGCCFTCLIGHQGQIKSNKNKSVSCLICQKLWRTSVVKQITRSLNQYQCLVYVRKKSNIINDNDIVRGKVM